MALIWGSTDLDYATAHLTEGKSRAVMILARPQRYSAGEQMRCVLKLMATKSAQDMRDQGEFLSPWG